MPTPVHPRRTLLAAFAGAGAATVLGTAAAAAPASRDVLSALARAAHPIRVSGPAGDLRPLGAAIGASPVVGLGEAVHGAHELFVLKDRVFRYLVREKGFTTFALETSWAAGLRIDDHVRTGTGDPRAIMAEEFGTAWPWNVHEYLDLIRWMRAYNVRHPGRPVRFVGTDIAHPHIPASLFDRVTGYAARYRPALEPRLSALYRELRTHATTAAFTALPRPGRLRIAADVREAHRLLAAQPAGPDRPAFDLAVQHARVIAQTATLLSHDLSDPLQLPEAMRYRDELMADNTAWWHRHTGHRMLLSAHNGHTAYRTYDPVGYPVIQGTYLRRLLGTRYLAIGTTFGRGACTVPAGDGWIVQHFGPPAEGSSEHTLDRVPLPAFAVDLRSAPSPAREWFRQVRPTRDVAASEEYRPYALAGGHDLLVHLRSVQPATPVSP